MLNYQRVIKTVLTHPHLGNPRQSPVDPRKFPIPLSPKKCCSMLSSGSETQEEQGDARGTAARFDEGKFQDDHKPSGEPVILMKDNGKNKSETQHPTKRT
jgi:hypothetical protein